MIKVCIVEDIVDIQEGMRDLFAQDDRFELIACFSNAEDAIDALPDLQPDVVITDINLPKKSGIDCVFEIKPNFPLIQFIMFTIFEDNDQVFEALKAGASGYILKNTPPEKIKANVIELYEGGSPMSPQIARKVLQTFNQPKTINVHDLVTKREFEVLELLSKGFLYKEIADQLTISMSTVKRHLNHIYEKLQVQNRTEAVNKLYGK